MVVGEIYIDIRNNATWSWRERENEGLFW